MLLLPSRRQVLALGASGAAGLIGRPARAADVELTLRARRAQVDLGGGSTDVWRYEAADVRAAAGAITQTADSYLGPTFRLRAGQRLRVRFENHLPEASIVHWHGLDVSERNDGHPRLAVDGGEAYQYDFPVLNRAGTYWYHPHPDGRTGPQVYRGLAGFFIVSDDEEGALGLPAGEQDLPLAIQDRMLDDRGGLVYEPDAMTGFLGDRVLVQGRAPAPVVVGAGSYRLRLLNASNARTYKLAWSDGSPLTVIASDGGLLREPARIPYLMLAPAERADVWMDFARLGQGGGITLVSVPFDGGAAMMGMGMGRGMGMRGPRGGAARVAPANGAGMTVCRFEVRGRARRHPLPTRLVAGPQDLEGDPEAPPARRLLVSMAMMRGFLINGRPFQMEEVAPNERVRLGATEDWEIWNQGGMMAMAHPIHFHGPQFQIVRRWPWSAAAATVREGLLDQGWKDTFLLMPGERMRIRVRFARHAGLFLYHCHILEHEDAGMMRNFLVEA